MKLVICQPLENMTAWAAGLSLIKDDELVYVLPNLDSPSTIILSNEIPDLVQFELLGVQKEFLHPDPDLFYMTSAALEYAQANTKPKDTTFGEWYDPYENTDDSFFSYLISSTAPEKTNSVEYFHMEKGALLDKLSMDADSTDCVIAKNAHNKLSWDEHKENMYVRRGVKK